MRRVDRKFVKQYDVAPHERHKRFSRACTPRLSRGTFTEGNAGVEYTRPDVSER